MVAKGEYSFQTLSSFAMYPIYKVLFSVLLMNFAEFDKYQYLWTTLKHINSSSVVERVVSKATGKVYARKRINRAKLFGHDRQAQKVYENEIKVLSKFPENDHLIKVTGTYTDKKYLVMLLEPVADENLKEYMNREPLTSSAEKKKFRAYFGCLAHTIQFLHDSSIETLHKDIKPENILLKDGHLILTDFGTAFDWSKTGQSMTRSNAGDHRTPRYQSPEVATASEFHRSSDIWSLGVVFLEMATVLRGKRIAELDSFLQNNGHRQTEIHLNLDAAMNWSEQLQKHGSGSPIDNEPLSWIKRMLDRVQSNRPTAAGIYQDIAAFHDGTFCGSCCSDGESSSSADEDFQNDSDMLSDTMEEVELHSMDPSMQQPDASDSRDFSQPLVKSTQNNNENPGSQFAQEDISVYSSIGQDVSIVGAEIDVVAPLPSEKRAQSPSKSRSHSPGPVSQTNGSEKQDVTVAPDPELGVSTTKNVVVKSGSRPFLEKETILRWLASSPEIVKPPLPEHQSASHAFLSSRPKTRDPTVESQRIDHFLSSLPEEIPGYEKVSAAHLESIGEGSDRLKRSQTLPTYDRQYMKRSHSQEELTTPSYLLAEETDNDQYSGVTNSRLVHYASDCTLNLALTMSKQTFREAIDDLKAAAAATTTPKSNGSEEEFSKGPRKDSTGDAIGSGTDFKSVDGSGPEYLTQTRQDQASDLELARLRPEQLAEPPRLEAFLGSRQSAKNIMERILDNKIYEAPTTVMSVSTRAKISQIRPLLRWTEKSLEWLPSCVATSKVGAVRELLKFGCNPGTAEKPRWEPIYNAIRGATDRHTKCLRAFVSYGVNVNAVNRTNGKRPIHYAIERAPWSGYSFVIFTLLDAKADPNAKDKTNNVPLLVLLAGDGRLPQEKRDVLDLLLAPNLTTNLNVYIPGTLDNPLHLAVRRKDAYSVAVILEKMKQVQGDALSLMHKYNSSGFTPLLLAFTTFTSMGVEAEEELQIIGLLLENGADPNDQDNAHKETPLHLVVRAIKNAIALELLCKYSANAYLLNNAGQSAIDLARNSELEYPMDPWYLFANRRMGNRLKDEHYRPPELMAFLDEEVGLATEGKE